MSREKRWIHDTSPVLQMDYPCTDGESIWPCPDCITWHRDLFQHVETRDMRVREWHAIDCPLMESALAENDDKPED